MQHQSLFVFDIETIPDTSVVSNLVGDQGTDDVEVLRKALEDYHLDITDGKNAFLRQPFHKVVAISFLEAKIHHDGKQESYELVTLRTGGKEDSSEEELVKGFFQHLAKIQPRLVSFNGRTFDLPVMKYRAMKYGIAVPFLYHAGDKWNNYTQRYSLDWHCDLLEGLSDFGASARVRLNEVCALLGLPGKIGVDGGDVQGLYDQGKIKEIRDYCETDVLNTYLVYLRFMQHRGTLATRDYEQAYEDVLRWLDKENQPHLQEFVAELGV